MEPAPFSCVDGLFDTLVSIGDRQGDDVIPALPHLLQTAANLASTHGDAPQLIAAGLVHDLATALDPACGDHARAGARLVEPLLGRRVAELVAGHTDAKRYLVTVEADYGATLSTTSTATLALQGGPMTDEEVDAFRRSPHWRALVALRRADDAAKVPGRVVPPVTAWRAVLDTVAATATAGVTVVAPIASGS